MNDAPRTIPHYINEDKSDMRGIRPGWYAIDEDGNLVFGIPTTNASRQCSRQQLGAMSAYSPASSVDRRGDHRYQHNGERLGISTQARPQPAAPSSSSRGGPLRGSRGKVTHLSFDEGTIEPVVLHK